MFGHSYSFALTLGSVSLVGLGLAAGDGRIELQGNRVVPHTQLASTEAAKAGAQQVVIDNFTYSPAELTVTPGTRVTWVNHDDVPHTVTSDAKVFSSPALDTDGTFSYVFSTPGTYPYYCKIHTHMTAKVIVK